MRCSRAADEVADRAGIPSAPQLVEPRSRAPAGRCGVSWALFPPICLRLPSSLGLFPIAWSFPTHAFDDTVPGCQVRIALPWMPLGWRVERRSPFSLVLYPYPYEVAGPVQHRRVRAHTPKPVAKPPCRTLAVACFACRWLRALLIPVDSFSSSQPRAFVKPPTNSESRNVSFAVSHTSPEAARGRCNPPSPALTW